MTVQQIKRIVILGGEGSEWIVAAALAQHFKGQLHISIVNGSTGDTHSAISSVQSAKAYHQLQGIDEALFIKKTEAGFKLGSQYKNVCSESPDFVHSLVANGFSLNGYEFHHYLQRLRVEGIDVNPHDFSLSAQAALQNRFSIVSSSSTSLFSSLVHAYHVNSYLYFDFFRQRSMSLGALSLCCEPDKVVRGEDGAVQHIVLKNEKIITADLWIDCSGSFNSILAESDSYSCWHEYLPVDKVIKTVRSTDAILPLLTQLQPHKQGWFKETPVGDQLFSEFYYSSHLLTEASALEEVNTIIGGANFNKQFIQSVNCGMRKKPWSKNCIFIGTSAGYLTELSIPQLHLIHSAMLRLIELFPITKDMHLLADEYNRITCNEYTHVRDIHQAHFLFMGQSLLKPSTTSETLNYKITLFKHCGKVAFYEEETYSSGMWASLFMGFGCWPDESEALSYAMPIDVVNQKLNQLKNSLYGAASELPLYSEWRMKLDGIKMSKDCIA